MKKKVCILIPVLLLMIFVLLILYTTEKSPCAPLSADQIDSVSLYYFNANRKKVIESQTDISDILSAMSNFRSRGAYDSVPAGGQTFQILFQLYDGSYYSCIYYQTAKSSGYYADGNGHIRVSSLDFVSIWENLDCIAVEAYADLEFSEWPEL